MNNSATKYLNSRDSEFPTGSCKKHRRRQRNRYKNYYLKKKKLKKFTSGTKSGSLKSDTFSFKPNREKIMSNWYWSNYRKAIEWQERHKAAHWKAWALALFEENRQLLGIINSMQPGMVSANSFYLQSVGRGINFKRKPMRMNYSENFAQPSSSNADEDISYEDDKNVEDGDDKTEEVEDEFEFEMSEEMIKFFEQSYKHKMDMKKLKENEGISNTDQQVQQIQSNKIKRLSEMNFLYGDGASMITGMETAVQLSFNKYCDIHSPKYWPNIPFKL